MTAIRDTLKGLVRGTVPTRNRDDLRLGLQMVISGRHASFSRPTNHVSLSFACCTTGCRTTDAAAFYLACRSAVAANGDRQDEEGSTGSHDLCTSDTGRWRLTILCGRGTEDEIATGPLPRQQAQTPSADLAGHRCSSGRLGDSFCGELGRPPVGPRSRAGPVIPRVASVRTSC